MARNLTKGYCKYCGKMYAKSGITRHLKSCEDRKLKQAEGRGKENTKYYTIMISGRYHKDYWMVVDVIGSASFQELDQFLRDIWLECCGHLSCFHIGGHTLEYTTKCFLELYGDDEDLNDMKHSLDEMLSEGVTFGHVYDYGTSTELLLEVKEVRSGKKRKDKIVIESRNAFKKPGCSFCGKEAKWVIPDGFEYYIRKPYMCEDCYKAAMEDLDSDIALQINELEYYDLDYASPICNSPRMGVCGYEGSRKYPEDFVPDQKA